MAFCAIRSMILSYVRIPSPGLRVGASWTLALICALAAIGGCGAQNEFLAEAKDLLKSDKRTRVELAVRQLTQAAETQMTAREEAETRYLLGYYQSGTVEERAAHFTAALDREPKRYEEALIHEALRDNVPDVREAVRMALAKQYRNAPGRIRKELTDALEGKDNRSRHDAAWVIGHLAAEDDVLANLIGDSLDHKRMATRLNAILAVDELARRDATKAQRYVPQLLEKIESAPKPTWKKLWLGEGEREDPEVRALAVTTLGTIGATDEILKVLQNKGSSLRSNAMKALIASGAGESAVDVLLGLLEEPTAEELQWTSRASAGRRAVHLR
ncbi:hypothetical protein CMK11_04670 [Candidatus Poribacteria bacterium]|nr:hypothetical protein [Candidatus Poribacteria bacterium]